MSNFIKGHRPTSVLWLMPQGILAMSFKESKRTLLNCLFTTESSTLDCISCLSSIVTAKECRLLLRIREFINCLLRALTM